MCVNLLDEAEKKGISVDLEKLEKKLGVPVAGVIAREKQGLDTLMNRIDEVCMLSKIRGGIHCKCSECTADESAYSCLLPRLTKDIDYGEEIESATAAIQPQVKEILDGKLNSRWVSLKIIDGDESLMSAMENFLRFDVRQKLENIPHVENAGDTLALKQVEHAEKLAADCVSFKESKFYLRDRKIDRILTHRVWGIPVMLLLLGGVLWITVVGANYPSSWLAALFDKLSDVLNSALIHINTPETLRSILIDGVYRVLAWVIAVMLPPMAIFFPLFTLLEDVGYLPRVAFNLDKGFKKSCACGKQALSMCMGLGCNAAGVIGCRIIDSPRERLIATITNSLVPCNGRFPTIISLIAMFFIVPAAGGFGSSVISGALLVAVIMLGVLMTLLMSKILSATLLKGIPSSFTLELPPYRKPQIGKVLVRSVLDRTIFVLGRACAVAAPAGLVIWLFANISVGGETLLALCSGFLDPFARFIGLDGVILLAFILGFPANEIVIPIIIMAYMATGKIVELESLSALRELFVLNGWTPVTAGCTILFMLFHWPCSTTCMTIYKETKSLKWTLVSVISPTVAGIFVCAAVNSVSLIFMQ